MRQPKAWVVRVGGHATLNGLTMGGFNKVITPGLVAVARRNRRAVAGASQWNLYQSGDDPDGGIVEAF